ncbi:hypothetical protein A8139_05520 [Marinomonas primoryensis]|uniref:Uncharacterized protein n=1 Tax=Marinomonas primoryensis TaxID=178399 RepID=A0A2Z4PPX1_9GAMM|nr:putative phage tail assembly chaperone [Marinomonas primoryensis]AWX99509.1 hypothetical protein A8139_05520 [Marinomonas primoryensis]
MPLITITLGEGEEEQDLRFEVTMENYNQHINDSMPDEKVGPAYNFLMAHVHQEDKAKFKDIILVDEKVPRGMLAILMMGEVSQAMNGTLSVKIKKPSKSLNK